MKNRKDYTDNEKYMLDYAQTIWSQQCKDFMLHNKPFTDKTLKNCNKRIVPSIF